MSTTGDQIIEQIRTGQIDINNQELFFSVLIKGIILRLNGELKIRNNPVPHFIVHTGSDALYLENKGQDMSIEPYEISNENFVYSVTPKCVVTPGGIDLMPEQLTNPYAMGQLQYDSGDAVYNLVGEMRRMPLKLGIELQYFTDSYRDMLELVQQIITKLTFIKTFNITYMGQSILCSYKIPESFSGEHLTELDGMSQDNKTHKLTLSLEVETNIPVYSERTIMMGDNIIVYTQHNILENGKKITV